MRCILFAGIVLVILNFTSFFLNEKVLIQSLNSYNALSVSASDHQRHLSYDESVLASHHEKYRASRTDARKRRLEFVHIPKTGGTAVETAAALMNITWSLCHFVGSKTSLYISTNITRCPDVPSTKLTKPKPFHAVPHWHLPPRYLYIKGKYLHNPYENATLFTIVRNPYERVISQYFHSQLQKENVNKTNDPVNMNTWIQQSLGDLEDTGRAEIGNPELENQKFAEGPYYKQLGHLIPQYDFVYDGQTRMIDHVLHFETLKEEFPILMKEYGLEFIRLPEKGKVPGRISTKHIGVANLTLLNIRLIESVYARDFAAFGYETISYQLENQYLMS